MAQSIILTNNKGQTCTIKFGDDGFLYIGGDDGWRKISRILDGQAEPDGNP